MIDEDFTVGKNKQVGLIYKRYRLLRCKSQEQVARPFGFTAQFVSSWERGLTHPPYKDLKKLSQYLSMPKSKIITAILEYEQEKLEALF